MSEFFGKLYARNEKARSNQRTRARDEKHGIRGDREDRMPAEQLAAEAAEARRADEEWARRAAGERKHEARMRDEEEARFAAEVEAKKAEQEAREKAEAEAQKAEQEAREKAKAEAQKAEQEAREKAEAEAKKAEQEARERAEAEAKKAEQEAREKAEAEAKVKAEQEAKEKAEIETKKAEAEALARKQVIMTAQEDLEIIGPAVRMKLTSLPEWNELRLKADAAKALAHKNDIGAADYQTLQNHMDALYKHDKVAQALASGRAEALAKANAPKPLNRNTVGATRFTFPVPGGHESGKPLSPFNTPGNLEPRGRIFLTNPDVRRTDGTPPNTGDDLVVGNLAYDEADRKWMGTVVEVDQKTPKKLSNEIDLANATLIARGGRVAEHRPWNKTEDILRRHAGTISASRMNDAKTGWIYNILVDPRDAEYNVFPNDPPPLPGGRQRVMGRDNIAFEYDAGQSKVIVFHSGPSS